MNKQKKDLVPELRFPEFKEKMPWTKLKIGKHLKESRIKGSTGDRAKKLTVKLWGNGVYAKDEGLKGSESTQYYLRSSGQFIYSKLDFLNQAFGVVPEYLNGYESTVDLPCFDVSNELDVRFLLEYVQRKDFYKKFGEIADGGRKAKRIQVETFLGFPILIPKIEEQQKIADCLASIDELITLHTQKFDALKTYKKGLMHQIFPAEGKTVPRLRFPEFRDNGEWIVTTIGSIGSISSGGTPSRTVSEYWNGNIPWVSTALIDFNEIQETNESITQKGLDNSSAKLFPVGTILMAMYGQGKTRGKVAKLVIKASINQACAAIKLKKGMNTEFVFQNLAGRYDEIRRISNSGGQENLSAGLIKNIPFTHPVIGSGEQERIANFMASIDEIILSEKEKVESLKKHKKGLIQKLFPIMDDTL
ncbi:hypothetical protein RC94_13965 [Pectobacterium brasiliense]|uniref:restriction endonuclease subunit S n=1 Tax=Pectobacterium brasiliense TaxID=180957 RepID=UPI00057E8689|nr:restriction endonuclease subunit S [Pectobacterium brasiliense]KHS72384.1 hypothetical protein RC79_14210 [Pectobacterium brasiliense]KHT04046.1 hypothetical protein RC92_16455 [Pectobacterium brasiliense]KHT07506.1 hypothetical protein RC94_13965 [Pectobacterium brasiliense]KHT16051.1 hypothetical protein RC95_15200 [Pectobacterium brasiliense]